MRVVAGFESGEWPVLVGALPCSWLKGSIRFRGGRAIKEPMMDKQANTDQADDEILNSTVSDEALEAAAGTEPGQLATAFGTSVC